MRPRLTLDAAATIAFFALGFVLSALVILAWRYVFFYPAFMPSAILWACGLGAREAIDRPEALTAFTLLQSLSFDCGALSEVRETTEIGLYAKAHLYLGMIAALLWRTLGVAHVSLWPLVAVLYGAYAAACFRLVRLYAPFWLAVGVGLILAASPSALSIAWSVRDFSKAPFILWAVVLLITATRVERRSSLVSLAGGAGAVLGIGTGFRPDVLICLPIALFVLVAGVAPARFTLRRRLPAAGLFLLFFAVLASPILVQGGAPSVGFFATQGATEPFRKVLGLGAAPYDVGPAYSDELAMTSITADLRPADPSAWDASEGQPFRAISQAMRRSSGYALRWALQFPADVATRAIKASYLIAGYYSVLAPERRALDPAPIVYPLPTPVTRALEPVYAWLAQPWLPVLGVVGLLALLARTWLRSPRECLCLVAILAAFLSYPSLQFSVRHFFHLEIFFWLGMVSLALAPWWLQGRAAALLRFGVWLAGGGIIAIALYGGLVAYQDRSLSAAIERVLAVPRDIVPLQQVERLDGQALLAVAPPDRYAALLAGPSDSLTKAKVTIAVPWQVKAAADRLVIVVGGPACGREPLPLTLAYTKSDETWQPFDRSFVVQPDDRPTVIIAPAFYRPTQGFAGFVLPTERTACVLSVARGPAPGELPASFTAVLPHDWRASLLALRPFARLSAER